MVLTRTQREALARRSGTTSTTRKSNNNDTVTIKRRTGELEVFDGEKLVKEFDPSGTQVFRVELERRDPSKGGGIISRSATGKTSKGLAEQRAISKLRTAKDFETARSAARVLQSISPERARSEIDRYNLESERKLEREITRAKKEQEDLEVENFRQFKRGLAEDFSSRTPTGLTLRTLPVSEEVRAKKIKELEPGTVIPEAQPRQSKIPKLELDVIKSKQQTDMLVKELETQARQLGDKDLAKRIVNFKDKGKFTPAIQKAVKEEIKNKRKKQEKAIKKILLVNNKLSERRKNYDRFVEGVLDRFIPQDLMVTDTGRSVPVRYTGKVLRGVGKAVSYLNPLVFGDQIGGYLDIIKTGQEAGFFSVKDLTKKGLVVSGKGIYGLGKDIVTLNKEQLDRRIKSLGNTTLRGLKKSGKWLKDPEHIGELIFYATLAGLTKKAIQKGIQITEKGGKVIVEATPKFAKEVSFATKKLLNSKAGIKRLTSNISSGKIVSKYTTTSVPKKGTKPQVGRGVKKGLKELRTKELRLAQLEKPLTPRQLSKMKYEETLFPFKEARRILQDDKKKISSTKGLEGRIAKSIQQKADDIKSAEDTIKTLNLKKKATTKSATQKRIDKQIRKRERKVREDLQRIRELQTNRRTELRETINDLSTTRDSINKQIQFYKRNKSLSNKERLRQLNKLRERRDLLTSEINNFNKVINVNKKDMESLSKELSKLKITKGKKFRDKDLGVKQDLSNIDFTDVESGNLILKSRKITRKKPSKKSDPNQQISLVEKGLKRGKGRESAKQRLLNSLEQKRKELQTRKAKDRRSGKQLLEYEFFDKRPETLNKDLLIPEQQVFDPVLRGYIDKFFTVQDVLPAGASSGFFRGLKKPKPSLDAKVKRAIDAAEKQLKRFKGLPTPKLKPPKPKLSTLSVPAILSRKDVGVRQPQSIKPIETISFDRVSGIKPTQKVSQSQEQGQIQKLSYAAVTESLGKVKPKIQPKLKKPSKLVTPKPLPVIKPFVKPTPPKITPPKIKTTRLRLPKEPKKKLPKIIPFPKLKKPKTEKIKFTKPTTKLSSLKWTPTLAGDVKFRKKKSEEELKQMLYTGFEVRA